MTKTDCHEKTTHEAVVKIKKEEEVVFVAHSCDSAIGTLYGAFQKALKSFYPEVVDIKLKQYSEVCDSEKQVRATVISSNGNSSVDRISLGVSSEDTHARILAVASSFAHKLEESRG